ncbi:MAG: hypothetical protein ACP5GU_07170 [Thermoprotei archaeon]
MLFRRYREYEQGMGLNLPMKNKIKRKIAIEDIIGKVLAMLEIEANERDKIVRLIEEKGSVSSLTVQTKWGIIIFPQDTQTLLDLLKNEEWDVENVLKRKIIHTSKVVRKRKRSEPEIIMTTVKISLDPLINEIKKYVYRNGIITLASLNYAQAWDVRKENDKLIFGTQPFHTELFYARIARLLMENGSFSFILRSFTDKKDNKTGWPIKELRGYTVKLENNTIKFNQSTLEELINAHIIYKNMKLAPEPAVIFCGPDGQISADEIATSIKRQLLEIIEDNIKINIITSEIPINKTDIFRSITDMIYALYEKYSWNYKEPSPEAFKRTLSLELQKLSKNAVISPTGKLLYNIEYPKWLPNKIKNILFSENPPE